MMSLCGTILDSKIPRLEHYVSPLSRHSPVRQPLYIILDPRIESPYVQGPRSAREKGGRTGEGGIVEVCATRYMTVGFISALSSSQILSDE